MLLGPVPSERCSFWHNPFVFDLTFVQNCILIAIVQIQPRAVEEGHPAFGGEAQNVAAQRLRNRVH